jgi:hypothetical protein
VVNRGRATAGPPAGSRIGASAAIAIGRSATAAIGLTRTGVNGRDRTAVIGLTRVAVIGLTRVAVIGRTRVAVVRRTRVAVGRTRVAVIGRTKIVVVGRTRLVVISHTKIAAIGHLRAGAMAADMDRMAAVVGRMAVAETRTTEAGPVRARPARARPVALGASATTDRLRAQVTGGPNGRRAAARQVHQQVAQGPPMSDPDARLGRAGGPAAATAAVPTAVTSRGVGNPVTAATPEMIGKPVGTEHRTMQNTGMTTEIAGPTIGLPPPEPGDLPAASLLAAQDRAAQGRAAQGRAAQGRVTWGGVAHLVAASTSGLTAAATLVSASR